MIKIKRTGFTLIELLVVIAIIGILSTLAIVALGSARQKARDSKRVADLNQVSKALELYFNDNNDYPTIITPGQPISSGSTVYMSAVPSNPTPRDDNNCVNSDYSYAYITGTYALSTCLGSSTGSLGAGTTWVTSQGTGSNRDGLMGFWKFGEGSGTTTADSSGNGNTGTLSTTPVPVWTTSAGCKFGNCIVFSNTNDYVVVANSASVNITGTKISFGGWVNFTSIASSTVLIHKYNAYVLYAKDTGVTLCSVGTGSAWDSNTASYTAPASGWHHVFCTYNGSAIKVFIDGDMKASTATSLVMGGNGASPRIGVRSDVFVSELNTGVDNVRLYNRALSDAEVKALYLGDSDN